MTDEIEQQNKDMEIMKYHNQMRDSVLDGAAGEIISDTIDFLSK